MTEQAKHTPGPWTVEATGSQPGAYSVVGDGQQLVALVYGETREAQLANARIIESALDLLAAAQLLETAECSRDDCTECEGEGEPEACGDCFPKFDDARIKRRAAIAKAEGAAVEPRPSPNEEGQVQRGSPNQEQAQ